VQYSLSFPLQLWLYESASLFRYTYIACLVAYIERNNGGRGGSRDSLRDR